jgi:hypothetical protein
MSAKHAGKAAQQAVKTGRERQAGGKGSPIKPRKKEKKKRARTAS